MAEDRLYKDLQITRRAFGQLTSDRETVDLRRSANGDLQMTSGQANLAQALVNRLLTRKGELARLGHPNYGSRLHQLIGELNNARLRGLAELYIRECLAQETRIEEVTNITFAPLSRGLDRNLLEVTISVKPVDADTRLTFTIPINLEG